MRSSHGAFRFSALFACASAALLVAPACSSRQGFDSSPPPSFSSQDASTDAPVCGLHCSRDLKTVVKRCGEVETVEETCGANQGCGPGRCVDACAAAAYSKGSIGCEFWTLPADDGQVGRGSCFAAMLANTWERPVTLAAAYGTEALDISRSTYTVELAGKNPTYTALAGPLAAGQVAIVFLAQAPNDDGVERSQCPAGVTQRCSPTPSVTAPRRRLHFT